MIYTRGDQHVSTFQLNNGLQVLVYPYPVIPWVSTQLWYRVGSKHEYDGIRGAAHLLEHMLFKGTQRMSELDVTAITDAFSGYTNAFTSQDYTAYLFDFPRAHWTVALDIFADCMSHATLKPELLHAELAAVIQELRLYNDDYETTLEETLTGTIFTKHPYHHPVIGYRNDLWKITDTALRSFYKQWYVPNNAVLVIVGDVTVPEVKKYVEHFFGHIPAGKVPHQVVNLWQPDLATYGITLNYDIHQLYDITAFVIPGFRHGQHALVNTLGALLADGSSSRLYKRLVYDQGCALSVTWSSSDLEEHDLFFIHIQHEHDTDRHAIKRIIEEELHDLAQAGPTRAELERAYALNFMDYQELLQDIQELTTTLGHGFVTTGDPTYGLRQTSNNHSKIAQDIQQYVQQWCRSTQAHYGHLRALSSSDLKVWHGYQKSKDKSDESFIADRVRKIPLEPLHYSPTIIIPELDVPPFPSYTKHELSHNSVLITWPTTSTETITIVISFPVSYYHEPRHKAGIAALTAQLVIDAISGYTSDEFADLIERRGMALEAGPGYIALTLLCTDWEYGFHILASIIAHPSLDPHAFERLRKQQLAELNEFFDDNYESVDQYARDHVYGHHPYGRLPLGSKQTIESLTIEDVRAWYAYAYQVYASRVIVVGNFNEQQIVAHVNKTWHALSGTQYTPTVVSEIIAPTCASSYRYTVSRDQTALCYAGLSVKRTDPWYDSLLLLDYLVCGGELNSMYSLLFQVRERTGLFYTVTGSPLLHTGYYSGIVRIKTLVSPDSVEKADYEIKKTLRDIPDYVTKDTLNKARSSIISARMHHVLSPRQLAMVCMSLERCGLSWEHEQQLPQRLADISSDTVCAAAEQFLNPDKLVRITVGR